VEGASKANAKEPWQAKWVGLLANGNKNGVLRCFSFALEIKNLGSSAALLLGRP